MKYSKVLSQYYEKWLRDAYDSVDYCKSNNNHALAAEYQQSAKKIFDVINENWDAIQFFSVGDRAFLYDEVIPAEFRGYE
jgi:hypothetical protein